MNQTTEDFDFRVRKAVFNVAMQRGYPPTLAEATSQLQVTIQEVSAAFQRLATGRVLVLQPESGEILMANPFSAVPTPFLVELEAYSCYGNCIWDALGVMAMLKKDGRIATSCPDCGTALEVRVANGSVQATQGLIHFAISALHWWDDIVFT
jgi:hypothetical protein